MAKSESPKKAAPARRRTTGRKQPDDPAAQGAAPERQPGAPPDGAPTSDAIARRAYEIYQARGGRHGTELDDWLQAERELADVRRQSTD